MSEYVEHTSIKHTLCGTWHLPTDVCPLDVLAIACEYCGAEANQPCNPDCLGSVEEENVA